MANLADLGRFILNCRLPDAFSTLTLFITSRCDAKCATCFYWQSLNTSGDLTLEELRTLSRTAPRFDSLWLSGGEPMLRSDLLPALQVFVSGNDVRMINLPSNGMHADRVENLVNAILSEHPRLQLWHNVSFDGLEATHDRLRGVRSNFRRAVEGLTRLQPLRERWRGRFRLNANTVICRDNVEEIMPLARHAVDQFGLDGHFFQIIRGTAMDHELMKVPTDRLRDLYREITPIQDHYARRFVRAGTKSKKAFGRAAYLGALTFQNRVQFANMVAGREWPMECTSGRTSLVIDHNGDVRACELREPIGNLREFGCDFGRLFASAARRAEAAAVRRDRCFCTHICGIQDSLRHSRRAMFYEIPRAFFTRPRVGSRSGMIPAERT